MKIGLAIFIILNSLVIFAQERYYSDPVKIPLLLSGTFAELRDEFEHLRSQLEDIKKTI